MPKRPVEGAAQINAELPVPLLDELKRFAKDRGEKVRDVLALAIRRHLDNPPPPPRPVEVPPLPPLTSLPEKPAPKGKKPKK
ncbi:unnamed protein product [Gemmata massiliana]|uniref:Ribbon-helix-helix protein CopG domain-containing protein n=1 Tax=Gemmata massiliana TaxID=1210884 RepID=A0A6P2CTH8_9BACT|nr:hypothetical protein [Gemmata massiliana]VTR91867.1 unnamed protein product [Gemmata massiliana]